MHGPMQTMCPSPWTQTYTLRHSTHTKTHTQTHREASAEYACTAVSMRALGHKHMLLYTDVSPGPAQPGPRAILGQAWGQQGQIWPAPSRPQPLCHRPRQPSSPLHPTPPPALAKSKMSRIPA